MHHQSPCIYYIIQESILCFRYFVETKPFEKESNLSYFYSKIEVGKKQTKMENIKMIQQFLINIERIRITFCSLQKRESLNEYLLHSMLIRYCWIITILISIPFFLISLSLLLKKRTHKFDSRSMGAKFDCQDQYLILALLFAFDCELFIQLSIRINVYKLSQNYSFKLLQISHDTINIRTITITSYQIL